MAKYQFVTLLPSESNASAGTKTVPINIVDPISKIAIINKNTNGSSEKTAHPAADISKIELIDGSNVLWSLSGKEIQALDFYNSKYMPDTFYSDAAAAQSFCTFNLNFGRKLWDPLYAFDPTKYRAPELRITHNYQTADSASTASTLEVHAHAFDAKKITPAGFLSAKEVKTYLTGSSGTIEQVDLPRDQIIRQLIIHGRYDTAFPWAVANHLKLIEDGKTVPFDFATTNWLKFINQRYPLAIEKCYLTNSGAARHMFCAPTFTIAPELIGVTAGTIVTQTPVNGSVPLHIVANQASLIYGQVSGWNPHFGFPVPFGDQDDPDDWYDPSGIQKTLRLEVTAGSAGGSGYVDIVAETVQKYGQ